MRKTLLSIALLSACLSASAQNIVSNGDFENYSICPNNVNMAYTCVGWHRATTSYNASYFNACSPQVNVPMAWGGYQQAASGSGYMGFHTEVLDPHRGYRDYITTAIPDMQIGATYVVSMDVSLANIAKYATNWLGMLFYTDNIGIDTNIITWIARTPQVDFSGFGIISDTANWVHVVDTFVADSAYKHIVIGNFKDTVQTILVLVNMNTSPSYGGYYYVDNVAIEKISTEGIATHNIASADVFPNPFTKSTTLTFSNLQHKNHSLCIYNIQGRLVQKQDHIITSEVRIERNDLSPGCYFYELKSGDGVSAKGKLFVQ